MIFIYPIGISIDTEGNVYVADTDNHRIQKFHSTDNGVTYSLCYAVGLKHEINNPIGVTVDQDGKIDEFQGGLGLRIFSPNNNSNVTELTFSPDTLTPSFILDRVHIQHLSLLVLMKRRSQ